MVLRIYKVSIQLLLLFYRIATFNFSIVSQFQYNFCYCSMKLLTAASYSFCGFNTTFVTVLSVWSGNNVEGMHVSIQLLLLFYLILNSLHINLYKFQYNFCYCSIFPVELFMYIFILFQYNFCYCSIQFYFADLCMHLSFQYNFCYCSMLNPSP